VDKPRLVKPGIDNIVHAGSFSSMRCRRIFILLDERYEPYAQESVKKDTEMSPIQIGSVLA